MATIDTICDLNRLKRSNDLAWKWFQRSGLAINKYISWVTTLKSKAEAFKKTLPVNLRCAFKKDLKHMFYAQEVENQIVIQYSPMVLHILRKLAFSPTLRDDLDSMGLIAIRNAVWQFRNVAVKCHFTTYVHNSIFMRLTGELSKHKTLAKRRSKKKSMTLHSDLGGSQSLSNLAVYNHKESDIETIEVLNKTLENMNMNASEKYLMNLLINRAEHQSREEVWYKKYLQNCKSSFPNGKISKEGIRQRILKLQKNFWCKWHEVQGLPIPVMPKPKMGRQL